jgi:hypothetical protein
MPMDLHLPVPLLMAELEAQDEVMAEYLEITDSWVSLGWLTENGI